MRVIYGRDFQNCLQVVEGEKLRLLGSWKLKGGLLEVGEGWGPKGVYGLGIWGWGMMEPQDYGGLF